MATVVNTPAASDSGSGMGFLVGAAVLLVAVLLAVFVLIPALSRGAFGGSAPQGSGVNIPEKVDVNVNGGQQ